MASRKDHRIQLKVVEAKGFSKDEEVDSYCHIKIYNAQKTSHKESTKGDSTPTATKNPLDRNSSLTDGNKLSFTKPNQSLDKTSLKEFDRLSVHSAATVMGRRRNSKSGLELHEQEKTKTCWKSKNPWFDEEFDFDLNDDFKEISIELVVKNILKDRIVGQITLPRYALELDGRTHEDWYSLRMSSSIGDDPEEKTKSHDFHEIRLSKPQNCAKCHSIMFMQSAMKCNSCGAVYTMKCAENAPRNCGILGQVRMKYVYTEEYIMPLTYYSKLLQVILDEDFRIIHLLGRVTDEREELARMLVIITENANLATKFLERIALYEIDGTTDPHTIFRANSLGSKAIDQYMKLIGMKYLRNTLHAVIKEIYLQSRPCELDPARLEKGEDKEENFTVLEAYTNWTLEVIFDSRKEFPAPLRLVFMTMRCAAVEKFPNDPVVKYTVITAFLFLRFFNAAILGPQLFGLAPDGDPPNARNSRTLTLLSKTIQQLANMTSFDGKKEPFMAQLNVIIENNIERMKKFVDELCVPVSDAELAAWHKKKRQGDKSAGLAKLFSAFRRNEKEEPKREVMIERYFGYVHRQLMKYADKMEAEVRDEDKKELEKTNGILDQMLDTYNRHAKQIQEEREHDLIGLDETEEQFGSESFGRRNTGAERS